MHTDRFLDNLIQDRHLQIKNSESAEYEAPLEYSIKIMHEYCLFNVAQKQLPINIITGSEPKRQLESIHKILEYFFEIRDTPKVEGECQDCNNYETGLQKLENDVRQHIRLEHQLKLYQESLEEKIEDIKKQNKEKSNAYNELKNQFQDYKRQSSKVDMETQRNRLERNKSEHNFKIERTSSMRKSLKHFIRQGKQNISIRNKSNLKKQHRKSMEKKSEKQKFRSTASIRSTNHKQPLLDKQTNRNKQDKKKAIQAKFVL